MEVMRANPGIYQDKEWVEYFHSHCVCFIPTPQEMSRTPVTCQAANPGQAKEIIHQFFNNDVSDRISPSISDYSPVSICRLIRGYHYRVSFELTYRHRAFDSIHLYLMLIKELIDAG